MQKDKLKNTETDELHEHYDFDYSTAKPNRFATRLTQEQLMVVIDPDMAVIFPTSEAVNEALRVLQRRHRTCHTLHRNVPGSHVKQRLFQVDKHLNAKPFEHWRLALAKCSEINDEVETKIAH